MYLNSGGNALFVDKSRLKRGHPRLKTPKIVGLEQAFKIPDVRQNLDSPLARFLAALFETCIEAEGSLTSVKYMVNSIINGMKNAGTLDLFRNGMPSIKQLYTKGKKLKDFTNDDKKKLHNTLTLYAIVYFRAISQDQLEGLVYGGRTIKGWERFQQHEGNITSKSTVKHAINHYETAKKFEGTRNDKGNKGDHVFVPLALVNKPDVDEAKITGIVRMLTTSDDPKKTPPFPMFGPGAIRCLIHGLNWSSPVMEIYHEEAALWTRTLVKDDKGKPHYWVFKDVDPFDLWAHARRITIRAEYKDDDGNTHMRYFRPRRAFSYYKNLGSNHGTPEEIFSLGRGWACMMSIFATFMWDWKDHPKGLKSGIINPWSTRFRSVEYDLFERKITVDAPSKRPVSRPQLLSFMETLARMKHRYGQDLIIGYPNWTPVSAGKPKVVPHYWDDGGKFWGTIREGPHCDSDWSVTNDYVLWEQ
ncbi:hypothetical protein LX32DRAFT_655021 [Colletotrichum zoysiae]|uniref:Uncharacterized protein n=1 Tax=Colletotrichum zoysiae TaxID=1216348 RepID=A0AAD9HBU5_9PEZI|nr:hypothetical protein LX32DRAFT_655021 [Colletotrichum zoysiae]